MGFSARVHPAPGPLRGTMRAPSSKNATTRAVLMACLARGRSILRRPAVQDDAAALVRCARLLGASIEALDADGLPVDFSVPNAARIDRLVVDGFGDAPRAPAVVVDPGNAGAVLRFLVGAAALAEGEVAFDTAHHKDSLGTRPNADLLDALRQLGVECDSGPDGRLPIRIRGGRTRIRAHLARRRAEEGIAPGDPVPVRVSGAISSQFASALLIAAPLVGEPLRVEVVDGLKSAPLVALTCAMMRGAGVGVDASPDGLAFAIHPQEYQPRDATVDGDWPGASALLAAACVLPGSEVFVAHLKDDLQGERRCLDFYAQLGARHSFEPGGLLFAAPPRLPGHGRIDGDQCTDAVLAMMGAAMLGDGTSRFDGIANLQWKECDRVRQPIAQLRAVDQTGPPYGTAPAKWDDSAGAAWWEPHDAPESIFVNGRPEGFEGGIVVDGCGDHRVIMQLSIVALRCRRGLTIRGAHHVAKSFPGWFDQLRAVGARVDEIAAQPRPETA